MFLGRTIWKYIPLRAVFLINETDQVQASIKNYRRSPRLHFKASYFTHYTKSGRVGRREAMPNKYKIQVKLKIIMINIIS